MRISDFTIDIVLHRDKVRTEWVDEYDHMNVAYYVHVCDLATYAFWELINDDATLEARKGFEYAVVESHVNYLQELRLDSPLRIETRLIAYDCKRFRIFHQLYHETANFLAATNEIMALGFDLNKRSICDFKQQVQSNLEIIMRTHRKLDLPPNAGRAISFGMP